MTGETEFSAAAVVASSGFVGRRQEMEQLMEALEDARSGRGRLKMLVGEPGIGKTRLAQELADHAASRGFQVLWGRCYEEGGTPPYWPWTQALRSHLREIDPERLRAELGPGAAAVAEIISELRDQFPDLNPLPEMEPDQARFHLFNSLTTFLKNAAQAQPLVLVLDDLHWSDTPSLVLLEFLAREIAASHLMVIGTYRDVELSRQHPLSKTLGGLAREQLYQRIPLRGLELKDLECLIQVTSGISPPLGLTRALQSHAEGNPFFATEVIRLLQQEGELDSPSIGQQPTWEIRIPEGVREVIGRRLDRLSDRCNQTLTVAAMVGRDFSLGQLEALIGEPTDDFGSSMDQDQLLEVLEEALQARVIEELPRTAERYQFTHALIQETLAGELSLTRRVRLHARIAETLEALYGDEAEAHAAELAHHFGEAEAVLGTEKLVEYSLIAGDRALAAYAWEEAEGHFQRALHAKEGQPFDDVMAYTHAGLGRALAARAQRHEIQGVLSHLGAAFDYFVEAGDLARAVEVADCPLPNFIGLLSGAPERVARALQLVPSDSHQAGRLLSRYGRLLAMEENDFAGAKEAFDQAISIARRERDTTLELQALAEYADIAFIMRVSGEGVSEGLELSLRAIDLAQQADHPFAEIQVRTIAGVCYHRKGDAVRSHDHLSAAVAIAERSNNRFLLARCLNWAHHLALSIGDWACAREFGERGLSSDDTDPRVLRTLIYQEYETGNLEQGAKYLTELATLGNQSLSQLPQFALFSVATAIPVADRINDASHLLELAESAAYMLLSSPNVVPLLRSGAHLSLALIAVKNTDPVLAIGHYQALKLHRHTVLSPCISCDRVLGLLARTMNDYGLAITHFEEGLTFCRQAGYRPELAWTCCDYADTLLQRNQPGDREKAMSLLEESLSIATELGMRPLMERVQSRLDGLGPPRSIYPDGLTRREAEVLTLIAQGKNNREIGEILVITEATARRHVSNIYDKIGAANRAEATRYALERELV